MARENEKIPTSRVRRTATVATLAASEATVAVRRTREVGIFSLSRAMCLKS